MELLDPCWEDISFNQTSSYQLGSQTEGTVEEQNLDLQQPKDTEGP